MDGKTMKYNKIAADGILLIKIRLDRNQVKGDKNVVIYRRQMAVEMLKMENLTVHWWRYLFSIKATENIVT